MTHTPLEDLAITKRERKKKQTIQIEGRFEEQRKSREEGDTCQVARAPPELVRANTSLTRSRSPRPGPEHSCEGSAHS